MKTFARLDNDFIILELIQVPDDQDISQLFTTVVVQSLVDVTSVSPAPACYWVGAKTGDLWTFAPPQPD